MRDLLVTAAPKPRYEVDDGSGRWLLKNGPHTVRATPGDTIAFCFDIETGVILSHGAPAAVRESCRLELIGRKFGARPGEPEHVVVIEARSFPLLGKPTPGDLHLTVQEINRCLHLPKYILELARRLEESGFLSMPRERVGA